MNEYSWKAGAHIKANPQAVGEALERLESVTAETVLEAARDKDSPMHNEFEWNDTAAAEQYRLSQARHIINCLTVKVVETEEKPIVRAYFKVADAEYEQAKVIMQIKEKRQSLLELAMSELRAFQRKYSMLTELAEIFEDIDRVTERKRA